MSLTPDYTLQEVAEALGMSERWVRDRVNIDGAECQRYGRKIRFTAEQVDALRATHTKSPVKQAMTTGKKKSA